MKEQSDFAAGGVWRTLKEAMGALVSSPLGCLALGAALLGVGGILHETEGIRKAESDRSAWARLEAQDIRDAVRDESAVRAVKVLRPAKPSKPGAKEREKALRAQVGSALAAAFSSPKR